MVVAERLPAYDERLRGYFENKAVHLRHLATLGCALPVCPLSVFVSPDDLNRSDHIRNLATLVRPQPELCLCPTQPDATCGQCNWRESSFHLLCQHLYTSV